MLERVKRENNAPRKDYKTLPGYSNETPPFNNVKKAIYTKQCGKRITS